MAGRFTSCHARSLMPPDTLPAPVESPPAAGRAELASRAPNGRRRRRKRRKSSRLVLPGLVLGFLTIGFVFTTFWTNRWTGSWTSNLAEPRRFDEADAYWLCKTMIEHASSDPGKTVIPHVENTRIGGNFHFAWSGSTQFMRLPTLSGLKAAATGSCTVDATQHNVKSLTIDGKVIR